MTATASNKETAVKTLLQINSSIFSNTGQSSQLANRFVDAWRAGNPDATIVVRDLASDPIPHLDAAGFAGFTSKPEQRSAEQQITAQFSDTLIAELKAADVLVLGLPFYNFGVPSMLKAYFDHIGRAQHTFKYTDKGPVGLLTGKRAYVFATRGGQYQGTPLDTQTDYVRNFLGFIGITDVQFIHAEGLARGGTSKSDSIEHANREIERIMAAELVPA